MSDPMATSAIHDIGYKRYTGTRLGRADARRSLFAHGVRTAFGLGRTGAAKAFPWVIIGILSLVAAILAAVRAETPGHPMALTYWDFLRALVILPIVFCAAVAPELVSRDLRGGVLPLYFSRPLSRTDYALAKFAAFATSLFIMLAIPELIMFIGGALGLSDIADLPTEAGHFGEGLIAAALYALVFGALALLAASLAGRRALAAALVVALFIITTPIYGVLVGISYSSGEDPPIGSDATLAHLAGLASPMTLVAGLTSSWFGSEAPSAIDPGPYAPVYAGVAAGLVVLALLLLLLRYRRVAR